MSFRDRRCLVGVALMIVLGGCASAVPNTPSPDGIAYREDQNLQKVWLADGLAFQSYQAFLVVETRTAVPNVNPDGVENLAWARGVLRDEIVTALRAKGLFPVVAVGATEIRPGTRALRLENTIIEYEKGGGGARFFAGVYGAGQPLMCVRGRVMDGDLLVFAFEARRNGDSLRSRIFGGYRSDKAIQEEDIRDLAIGLVDFMARNGVRR